MEELLETFAAFEAEHPDASSLQSFRNQIAQIYFEHGFKYKAREWLKLIIEKAGPTDSFYKDLAEQRLLRKEYQ